MRTFDEVTKFMGETKDFKDVLKSKSADIKDLVGETKVTLEWDITPDTIKHQILRIIMTDKEGNEVKATVSAQALQHYLRVV